MKAEIKIKKVVELKTLVVNAEVRYWEDSSVNGQDDENGDLIPCRDGDRWTPIIDIDKGTITNWEKGKTASIHYKVCDCFSFKILDNKGDVVIEEEEMYVPDTMCPAEKGYGDYVIMNIDASGCIQDWEFDVDDFVLEEE